MKRQTMVALLRAIVIILAALCVLLFFVLLPMEGKMTAEVTPEYAWAYWPCLIFAWVFCVPVLGIAVPAWQIFGTLKEKGRAFCHENARRFRIMALCAWAAAVIFAVGVVMLAVAGVGSGPLWFSLTPLLLLGLVSFGFACYAMSRLVRESAEMQEENRLTV